MSLLYLLLLGATSAATTRRGDQFDPSSYSPENVFTRDVVVIGGGAGGTYAAINLSKLGKSVVVVELQSELGGHVNTYIDPATGIAVDYGVTRYVNEPAATDFFDYLGIAYTSSEPPPAYTSSQYVDFATGKQLSNFTPGSNFAPYIAQVAKYPYLSWTTDLSQPVPSDLYLSFGDFVKKYALQELAFTLYSIFYRNSFDTTPALYFLSEIGLDLLESEGSSNATIAVAGGQGNHETYAKALQELGANVLLQSRVIAALRSDFGSFLVVQTPEGLKLVVAKQVLITIPTTTENMIPFGLDFTELAVFNQFSGRGVWTGLVNITGLPSGVQYVNTPSDTPYHIPAAPAVSYLMPTAVKDVYNFFYSADEVLPAAQVESDALENIKTLIHALPNVNASNPEIVAFASHAPFRVALDAESIKAGAWHDMYELQGHRGTWYTGCQFLSGSSPVWNYTLSLLPQIIAKL